jgi:hypothetical protein
MRSVGFGAIPKLHMGRYFFITAQGNRPVRTHSIDNNTH